MDKIDLRDAVATAAVMVTCGLAGRIGYKLFGADADPPPPDPAAVATWRRKRRWLVLSELSALPCFVALTILLPEYLGWSATSRSLFGLALGGLGWPFASAIFKAVIERRLGVAHAR